MKDVEYVRKAKAGDKQAFSYLYEMIYADMYKYAVCVLNDKYEAEDVVSETVIDAYKSIRLLKDEKLFKNWIFKILSNKCKRKLVSGYMDKTALCEESEMADNSTADMDEIMDLKMALGELSFEEKSIVTYKAVYGYSSKDIAKLLSLNENTVRSKLSRAISKMKCRMEA